MIVNVVICQYLGMFFYITNLDFSKVVIFSLGNTFYTIKKNSNKIYKIMKIHHVTKSFVRHS
jgi:hypothetical protein